MTTPIPHHIDSSEFIRQANGYAICKHCGGYTRFCSRCGLIGQWTMTLSPPFGTKDSRINVMVCDKCYDDITKLITSQLPYVPTVEEYEKPTLR